MTDAKIYSFEAKTNGGQAQKLAAHKGKVLLIVNTASRCGYTPQYEGLETLYKTYKDRGFEVLAFPANEFGAQEPGTDAEIKSFCELKYHVTFPLYAKAVVKGAGIHPLFAYLTQDSPFKGDIGWNFAKFLVGRDGAVLARFGSGDKPLSDAVKGAVEKALAAK